MLSVVYRLVGLSRPGKLQSQVHIRHLTPSDVWALCVQYAFCCVYASLRDSGALFSGSS